MSDALAVASVVKVSPVGPVDGGDPLCSPTAASPPSLVHVGQRLSSGALWSVFDLAVLTAPSPPPAAEANDAGVRARRHQNHEMESVPKAFV